MTDKELKKLKREDLLELLLAQSRENEELKKELETTKAELAQRRLVMENAGSIAEAALQLSGIFETAQKAADMYLAGVRESNPGGPPPEKPASEPQDKASEPGKPEIPPETSPPEATKTGFLKKFKGFNHHTKKESR